MMMVIQVRTSRLMQLPNRSQMPDNPKVVEALEAAVAADPESMEMPTTADADKVVAVADMIEQLANAIAERAETAAEEAAVVAEKAERAEEMVAERGGGSAAAKQVGLENWT